VISPFSPAEGGDTLTVTLKNKLVLPWSPRLRDDRGYLSRVNEHLFARYAADLNDGGVIAQRAEQSVDRTIVYVE
jgi:hypothetical protein